MNSVVSQEPHDFNKPIACLIIKIFMIGITHFENRLPNGFHNTTELLGKTSTGYGKIGHSKKFYFFEAFLDHFEAQFF